MTARGFDWAAKKFPITLAIIWSIAHVAAIFTENVSWDEFALLQRVELLSETHRVDGGGRPGALEIMLLPIVTGCRDAIATVHKARILGAAAMLFAILGLFELVRRLRVNSARASHGAWLAVGLWALALPFQRWSIQIRTDQFGALFGVWAIVALLGTRRPAWSAALAGACFGAGFLFTQKVLYLMLLGAIARCVRGPLGSRAQIIAAGREALACTVMFAVIVIGSRELVSMFLTLPPLQRVEHGLRALDDYRRVFGFALHRGLLAASIPHLLATAVLAAASVRALLARSWQRQLSLAWALLAAGTGVAVFHSGAFPYFWITLGLFPAVALGASFDAWSDVFPERVRALTVAMFCLCLIAPAAIYTLTILDDTQRPQREALRFTAAELGPPRLGFQLEGALLCRKQSDVFKVYFRPHIEAAFAEPGAAGKISAFIQNFRDKPVHFVIDSHMIGFFPKPITEFWQANYLPYRGPVCVVGRALAAGESVRWDVFAPGPYRWLALDAARTAELEVGGVKLRDRQTIALERGIHELHAVDAGWLVYAVHSGPSQTSDAFYAYPPIREIIGGPYFAP